MAIKPRFSDIVVLAIFKQQPNKILSANDVSKRLNSHYGKVYGFIWRLRKKGKLKRIERGKYISIYNRDFDLYVDLHSNGNAAYTRGLRLLTFLRNSERPWVSMEVLEKRLELTRNQLVPELSLMIDVGLVKRTGKGNYRLVNQETVDALWK